MLTYLGTVLRGLIMFLVERLIQKSHETRDRWNMSLRASFMGVTLPRWSLQEQFKFF